MRALIAIVVLAGCKKSPPRFEGPLRLEFGDCAQEPSWVSGPKPLPIPVKTAAKDKPKDKPKDPPKDQDDPPPPEDVDDSDDPKLARQQAIEAARKAGILGSTNPDGGAFASLTGTGDVSSGFDDSNIYGGLLGNEEGEVSGWGTIGTGRYGTIGTGQGYGVRSGGMRGRRANVPTVSIGQPNTAGDLDKAIIRRYIKRNIQKIQYCYEKELLAKPTLSGTVQTQFIIDANGHVPSATGNGVDKEVASCVANVIKAIEFPKPKGGSVVQVNYPFTFRPAEGGGGTAQPGGSYSADDIDVVMKSRASRFRTCYQDQLNKKPGIAGRVDVSFQIGPTGKVSAASVEASSTLADLDVRTCVQHAVEQLAFPARNTTQVVRYPFVFAVAGNDPPPPIDGAKLVVTGKPLPPPPPQARPYTPGTDNPLRTSAAAIEECVRTNGKPYGAVAIGFDDAAVKVFGVDDSVADCIAEVAKAAAKPGVHQTCSLAFGDIPAAELPGVDVSATAISFGGAQVTTVDAVLKDETPTFKIDILFEKLDGVATDHKLSKAPVAIEGPLAIRAIDATPIRVVNKVVNTARAAGADPVMAREQPGGAWKLLHLINLPAVPVPRGTGGFWTGPQLQLGRHSDEHVVLSILVQKDQMWIGLSRINEFQPIAAGAYDKLKAVLEQNKKSPFFVDRSDVEIAGEGCTYGDVAKAIEVARDAGFIDFYFVDPAGLSARPTL